MEYFLELNNEKEFAKTEPVLREFLLKNCNVLRLTQIEWKEGLIFRKSFGGEKDSKFQNTLKKLNKYFIKSEQNNKLYEVEQFKKSKFTHYFYKISQEVKKMINQETIFWLTIPPITKNFYGFENPAFYKNDKLKAHIISHENMVMLNLDYKEKEYFSRKGIELNSISN